MDSEREQGEPVRRCQQRLISLRRGRKRGCRKRTDGTNKVCSGSHGRSMAMAMAMVMASNEMLMI